MEAQQQIPYKMEIGKTAVIVVDMQNDKNSLNRIEMKYGRVLTTGEFLAELAEAK
jgi:hypothetical protein